MTQGGRLKNQEQQLRVRNYYIAKRKGSTEREEREKEEISQLIFLHRF